MAKPLIEGRKIPQFTAGSRQVGLDTSAQILGTFAFKPGHTAADSIYGMSIAIAYFWETVALAISLHGNVVGIDATETGIPCFDAIEPDILRCVNAIHNVTLAAVAEEAMQWVSDDC